MALLFGLLLLVLWLWLSVGLVWFLVAARSLNLVAAVGFALDNGRSSSERLFPFLFSGLLSDFHWSAAIK
jgi:hypothetical protein